jgi:hypothetical protein
MIPVQCTYETNSIIHDIPNGYEYKSKEDAWIDGVVKPDESTGNIGKHLTLQSGIVTTYVEQSHYGERLSSGDIECAMKKIMSSHIDSIYNTKINITDVVCMPTVTTNGVEYACVVFVVDVPKSIQSLRAVLHTNFPSVTYYPDWKAHVTVGYFNASDQSHVVKILKECIGSQMHCTGCVFDVRPARE